MIKLPSFPNYQREKHFNFTNKKITPSKLICIHLWIGFPCGSDVKTSACNAGDLASIPGSERSPGEGNGYPLQSILKEITGMIPEYSLEGLMLKVKLQYSGHLMWRADWLKRPWCWERLRSGGGGGRQRMRYLDGISDWMDLSLGKLWKILKDREDSCAAVHGVTLNWTQLRADNDLRVF